MSFGTHDFLQVDPDFAALIPPPSKEEYHQLEANILAEGKIIEAVDVWGVIVVDGMTRLSIARKHDLPFEIRHRDFDSDDDAAEWMLRKQLGRRNLTPEKSSLLRASLYENQKRILGKKPGPKPQKGELGETVSPNSAAAIVTKETGVTLRTLQNDVAFSADVKELADDVSTAVVTGEVKATRAQVHELAKMPAKKQRAVVAKVKAGAKMSEAIGPKPSKNGHAEPPEESWLAILQKPYADAIKSLQSAGRNVKAVAELERDGAHLAHLGTWQHIKGNINEAIVHIKGNMPAAGCPKCSSDEVRGKGCKACYGCGFISSVVHKGLTAKV